MRLRHIEIFEAIRQAGSLTQAATLLNISQPAASKILAHAEAQLGFKLFERVKGRLVPTREADILAPQVARLNQDLASIKRLAANLRQGKHGHLRIGCAPAIGLGLLPLTIQSFHQQKSTATFEISTLHSAELIAGLRAHELDLIITFDTTEHPGVTRKVIGQTELAHLSCNPATAPVHLDHLPPRDLIVLDARDQVGALLESALASSNVQVNAQIVVQTYYVACGLVEAGCGDAIVDMLTGRAMLKPGMVLRRLTPTVPIPICIMTHATNPQSMLHHDFVKRLTDSCQSLEMPENEDSLQL